MAGYRLGVIGLLGATAAMTTLATAGCTATVQMTGNRTSAQSTPVYVPVTGTFPRTQAPPTANNPTSTVARLQFPNTSFTASLTGYDDTSQMVWFTVEKWVPGGPDDGHYENDPAVPGRFRLPLAPTAKILTVSTLCVPHETPDLNGTPCTSLQLITGLRQGNRGVADVHVDSTDHIDSIKEDYVP